MNDAIIIAIIGSGAMSAVVSAIVALVSKLIDNRNAQAQGLQVLLEDRINYLGRSYLKDGYIYTDDLDRLHRMWAIYHDKLKGNGYLDYTMQMVDQLPRKTRGIQQSKS